MQINAGRSSLTVSFSALHQVFMFCVCSAGFDCISFVFMMVPTPFLGCRIDCMFTGSWISRVDACLLFISVYGERNVVGISVK